MNIKDVKICLDCDEVFNFKEEPNDCPNCESERVWYFLDCLDRFREIIEIIKKGEINDTRKI